MDKQQRDMSDRTVFRANDYDILITCMECGWAIGDDVMREEVEPLRFCPGCGKVIDEVDICAPGNKHWQEAMKSGMESQLGIVSRGPKPMDVHMLAEEGIALLNPFATIGLEPDQKCSCRSRRSGSIDAPMHGPFDNILPSPFKGVGGNAMYIATILS